jgi:hypothetical protein
MLVSGVFLSRRSPKKTCCVAAIHSRQIVPIFLKNETQSEHIEPYDAWTRLQDAAMLEV